MDLSKTGKFIQEQRKAKKLTQTKLAEILCVSEKTISKWECGKGFPDTSLMLPLCNALDITANELLSGKLLSSEEYKSNAENNLIELKSQQEKNNKRLFTIEWILVWFSVVILLGCVIITKYFHIPIVWKVVLIIFGFLNLLVGLYFSLIIETKVGFYKCSHCHHKYIPTYNQVVWSMHFGRTRYMKCPKCHKRSWNKKSINRD